MNFSLVLLLFQVCQAEDWLQWGGPNRNFVVSASIADTWSASGPKILWKRPLGEGFSSVLVEGGVLYTMYRRGAEEVVLAADAATGKAKWEQANAAAFVSQAPEQGIGPRATPLIVGDRLFTAGITGLVQCFDKTTGARRWTRQLRPSALPYGYAASPLSYRDLLILPVGGQGSAMTALRQSDGSVVWTKNNAQASYVSPLLISVDGTDQVVQLASKSVFAVNPLNGDLQWFAQHETPYGLSVATPVYADGLLFVSSGYGAGGRMFELKRKGNKTEVRELWKTSKLGVHHGNVLFADGVLYGSHGNTGTAALTAIEARSGRVLWTDPSFQKSTLLSAGGKAVLLDQNGSLFLTRLTSKGVQILAQTEKPVLAHNAWTPPSLVGTTLYLRDRASLAAVELGRR